MNTVEFSYQVRKSARRKTVSITVFPDNRVIVTAPASVSRMSIHQFVEKKSDWIRKVFQANLQKAQETQQRQFKAGEKLLYLGKEFCLRIDRGNQAGVELNDAEICVRLHPEESAPEPAAVRFHLIKWYQQRALAKVKEKIPHYAAMIGVSPGRITLKSMKSRWGSCSTTGRISLSWNLIMAPEPVLDYLIVHELCHMVHHNHSAEYWELVGSILPDHREKRKWLNKNGKLLSF